MLPNRPIQDVAISPQNALVGYAAVGGFDENTTKTPGHVFQLTCTTFCSTFTWVNKTGNLPNIPVNAIAVNPNAPEAGVRGTDWGLYYTDNITATTPVWNALPERPPEHDDLGASRSTAARRRSRCSRARAAPGRFRCRPRRGSR